MRILVTFAVDAELAPWRTLRDLQRIADGELTLHRAQVGRAQVDFLVTGMGVENARRAASKAMKSSYQICISSGFAGGLGDKLRVGDILVAEAVQQLGKPKTLNCSRNLVYDARQDGANPDHQHPRQYSQGLSAFVVRKSAIDAVLARLAGRISVHFGCEPMR